MEIARESYLKRLLEFRKNGQIKVVTGIRRCGKSYLLRTLFKRRLLESGIKRSDILEIALDDPRDLRFRNPLELSAQVDRWLGKRPGGDRVLMIDEIQLSDAVPNPWNPDGKRVTFYDALNGFARRKGLDVYVTGSNSKMLSSDILTEFRGRGDEIRLHPLSFAEYLAAAGGDRRDAFDAYARHGGMPFLFTRPEEASRETYLRNLVAELDLKDIVERKKVARPELMDQILDLLCSATGSLTNPHKIAESLKSRFGAAASVNTVAAYIGHLEDAYLFSEAKRYDVKGRRYFEFPKKYYCEDIGLRNARLGFRQQEITHAVENVVWCELVRRGFQVDVGVVESNERNAAGKSVRVQREIDFVVNKSGERVYVQSAWALPTDEKRRSELKPFLMTGDSFRKIIVRGDVGHRWFDETGVLHVGLLDFLLDPAIV